MEKIMFTWWNLQRYLKSEKGQGMVEYALVVGLIALASMVAMTNLSGQITANFNDVIAQLKTAIKTAKP